jgi:tRNA nucleotidyltransferase/poly(A) polymerase
MKFSFAINLVQFSTLPSTVDQKTVSVGVVLKNPEKSKHLETATMKVGSSWVNFGNLRAEEYTKDSRIPDFMRTSIGSPSEDAFRQDLTINFLQYQRWASGRLDGPWL